MHYIVGLGNPGLKYAHTRHNVAWMVLDAFIKFHKLPKPHTSKKFSGEVSEGGLHNQGVILLYPHTYMNESGKAVSKLVPKNEHSNLVVIHDDIALPLGALKISFGRGAGGHNGVISIIESLQSKEFIRVRVGVGEKTFWPWEQGDIRKVKGDKRSSFVLQPFRKHEEGQLKTSINHSVEAITAVLEKGMVEAMGRYNTGNL